MSGVQIDPKRLKLLTSGKVRQLYQLEDQQQLLMVASDRISTYDSVHPTTVPDKGRVLTAISCFWFKQLADVVPNHLIDLPVDLPSEFVGRSLLVKRLKMLPVECVVRGYLAGSGWQDYLTTGTVCGIELPPGLEENSPLPEPIFTPATKAEVGDHDQNITVQQAAELLGSSELIGQLEQLSIKIYQRAAAHAASCGIVLADTKFEFGVDNSGQLVLADEVLTPDSSRFWDLASYRPGAAQASFDKQFVRDWVTASGWDKTPPAPPLPEAIIQQTKARYLEAYLRLTGEHFQDWYQRILSRHS